MRQNTGQNSKHYVYSRHHLTNYGLCGSKVVAASCCVGVSQHCGWRRRDGFSQIKKDHEINKKKFKWYRMEAIVHHTVLVTWRIQPSQNCGLQPSVSRPCDSGQPSQFNRATSFKYLTIWRHLRESSRKNGINCPNHGVFEIVERPFHKLVLRILVSRIKLSMHWFLTNNNTKISLKKKKQTYILNSKMTVMLQLRHPNEGRGFPLSCEKIRHQWTSVCCMQRGIYIYRMSMPAAGNTMFIFGTDWA